MMISRKMSPQIGIVGVEGLETISIAEVTKVVIFPQVFVQLFVVKISVVTVLANGVTLKTGVALITLSPVPDQKFPAVCFSLVCEVVQVLDTKLTIVSLMFSSYVLVQLTKGLEVFIAFGALVVEHCEVLVLDLLRLEAYFELSVHWIDIILYQFKLGLCCCKNDLWKVSPTNRALIPLTEHSHPCGADVTYWMVALSHRENLHLVEAN